MTDSARVAASVPRRGLRRARLYGRIRPFIIPSSHRHGIRHVKVPAMQDRKSWKYNSWRLYPEPEQDGQGKHMLSIKRYRRSSPAGPPRALRPLSKSAGPVAGGGPPTRARGRSRCPSAAAPAGVLGTAHALHERVRNADPGTSLAMNSACRRLSSGITPAMIGIGSRQSARGTRANSARRRSAA